MRAFMTENTVPLHGVQACVFDAYGTLFDFAAAARKSRDVLGDDIDRLTALWRDKQLQYTWLRAAQERHTDFWQVTGDALEFALETMGLEKPGLRARLMSLYLTLDPFPEVPSVLRKLKTAGMRTAILSNGSPAMLDAAVKAARLEPLLDAVLSVEEVGVYKPHPKVLPAGGRSSCHSCIGNHLPVLQCLGCLRSFGIWNASCVVQPVRPTSRTFAGVS